jgi:hypothetical protein
MEHNIHTSGNKTQDTKRTKDKTLRQHKSRTENRRPILQYAPAEHFRKQQQTEQQIC